MSAKITQGETLVVALPDRDEPYENRAERRARLSAERARGRPEVPETHAALPAPPKPYEGPKTPGTDLETDEALDELEARRPHAVGVAARLAALFRNDRRNFRLYHSCAIHFGEKGWRPNARRTYSAELILDSLLGRPTGEDHPGGAGLGYGVGLYCLDEANEADWIGIDVDAHKEGETAETPFLMLCGEAERRGVPLLTARSRGGRGYHAFVRFSEKVPGRVAQNFGRWLARRAGLPDKTEVFPKSERLAEPDLDSRSKIAGAQIALPGCLNFKLAKGGSVLLENGFAEVPFRRWAEKLDAWEPVYVPFLHQLCAASQSTSDPFDFFSEPAREYGVGASDAVVTAAGVPKPKTAGDVAQFLEKHGVAVLAHRGPHSKWTDRLVLRCCANAEAHGSSKTDGACVLFDARSGRVGYKCWHEGCAKFSWGKLLKKLGYRLDVEGGGSGLPDSINASSRFLPVPRFDDGPSAPQPALADPQPALAAAAISDLDKTALPPAALTHANLPPPPPPQPRAVDDEDGELPPLEFKEDPSTRRVFYSNRERDLLNLVAVEHLGAGSPERRRLMRIAECYRMEVHKRCPDHGTVHKVVAPCGYANGCPCCGTGRAMIHRAHVQSEWPEVGCVLYDFGAESAHLDPAAAFRALRAFKKRVRLFTKQRKSVYRTLMGAHRFAVFFKDTSDALYLLSALGFPAMTTECVLEPMEAGKLVGELVSEPSLLLKRLLGSAAGVARAIDYPFLTGDGVRRSDGNRKGDRLPWYSEEEAREAARLKAQEREGADPDWDPVRCSRKVLLPGGGTRSCGKPLKPVAVLDDVDIVSGRSGGPAWAVTRSAFVALAAERAHDRCKCPAKDRSRILVV